jgi:beta-galactosidase
MLTMIVAAGFQGPPISPIIREDIEKAKKLGYSHVKFDVNWGPCEPHEGALRLEGLKRGLDWAGELGLKVVINFFGTPEVSAPQWAFEKFSDARYVDHNGISLGPAHGTIGTGLVGGYPGLCYDSKQVRDITERFFDGVINAFKNHEALLGWDVWSEPMTEPVRGYSAFGMQGSGRRFCYCKHTSEAFRRWAIHKYNNIRDLNAAWGTAYTDWDEIIPPVPPVISHLDWIDWKTFMADRMAEQMAWKVDVFKSRDPEHSIMAHPTTVSISTGTMSIDILDVDHWKLQAPLDEYGVSFYHMVFDQQSMTNVAKAYASKADVASWMILFDEIRSGCLKTKQGQWFSGEFQVAPFDELPYVPKWKHWLSRMAALACGISSFQDWCLRIYTPDLWCSTQGIFTVGGEPGPWADDIKKFNALAKKMSEHWTLPKINSQVAILFDPKTHHYQFAVSTLLPRPSYTIQDSIMGFYRMACALQVPIDFLHEEFLSLEELSKYKTLILPYQPIISDRTAQILRGYVKMGGNIVAEACLGRYKDHAWVCTDPPHGLQDVFGCKTIGIYQQDEVKIKLGDITLTGRDYWEQYKPTTGEVLGVHEEGSPAVIRSKYGKGSTLLIGTVIGKGYEKNQDAALRSFLAPYLPSELSVKNIVSPTSFTCRLIHCKNSAMLILMNAGEKSEKPTIIMEQKYSKIKDIETGEMIGKPGNEVSVEVPYRGARIILLSS